MNKIVDNVKNNWKIYLGVLLGILLLVFIIVMIVPKDETVRCDNNKAIEQLREQNLADLTKAADDFMILKQGDNYSIIYADEVDNIKDESAEFARLHFSNETDETHSVKVDYNKSEALIENINKDINEVQCTVPAAFTGFSTKDKKATLSGLVQYTIHANDRGKVSVTAASLEKMFRTNFSPIYNNRQHKYLKFEYKTGTGEVIDKINDLPAEEFGDFFNPLDY